MDLDAFCATTDWTPELQNTFWALLAKSRKRADTKARLVMQKVTTLRRYRMPREERRPDEVIALLRDARARGLFPDETESLHIEGEMLFEAGRPTEAVAMWEKTLAQMAPSDPNRQRTELRILRQWQAEGRDAEILQRAKVVARRDGARECFGLAVLLSEIAAKTGDYSPSDRLFSAFYATHEHRTGAELEALPCVDLDGEPLTDPACAADGIVVEFNPPESPSRWVQALTEVEQAMRALRTTFENGKWVVHCYDLSFEPNYEPRIIPDLGSFICEVLVRSHRGRWTDAPLLMRRRVELGSLAVDPFEMAWKTAYYRHSIVRQVRLLVG